VDAEVTEEGDGDEDDDGDDVEDEEDKKTNKRTVRTTRRLWQGRRGHGTQVEDKQRQLRRRIAAHDLDRGGQTPGGARTAAHDNSGNYEKGKAVTRRLCLPAGCRHDG